MHGSPNSIDDDLVASVVSMVTNRYIIEAHFVIPAIRGLVVITGTLKKWRADLIGSHASQIGAPRWI